MPSRQERKDEKENEKTVTNTLPTYYTIPN